MVLLFTYQHNIISQYTWCVYQHRLGVSIFALQYRAVQFKVEIVALCGMEVSTVMWLYTDWGNRLTVLVLDLIASFSEVMNFAISSFPEANTLC